MRILRRAQPYAERTILELADQAVQGLDDANGIPIEVARKLFPNKCLEMLVAGGMTYEDAQLMIPEFVL